MRCEAVQLPNRNQNRQRFDLFIQPRSAPANRALLLPSKQRSPKSHGASGGMAAGPELPLVTAGWGFHAACLKVQLKYLKYLGR